MRAESEYRSSTAPAQAALAAAKFSSVPDAYVIDALRTPIGRYGGALANARPDDLAAHVMRAAVERNELPGGRDRRRLHGLHQPGRRGQPQRRAHGSLLAGLPVEVPGVTVNRLCASGPRGRQPGARAHDPARRRATWSLAGGVESMTRAPLAMPKPDRSFPRGNLRALRHHDRLALREPAHGGAATRPRRWARRPRTSPSATASRASDQDEFALESHRRAVAATEAGRFDEEIVPVPVPQPKGDPVTVHADEGPRAGHHARASSARLKPGLPRGRHGDGRQLLRDQRRRRLRGARTPRSARARSAREPLARIVAIGAAGRRARPTWASARSRRRARRSSAPA